MTIRRSLTAALACAAVVCIGVSGCSGKSDTALTPAQQQTNTILKNNSKTNWDSLSQADKDTLTKTVGYGNPEMAKAVFSHKPLPPGSRNPTIGKPNAR